MKKEFGPSFLGKNLSLKDFRKVSAMLGTGLSLTAALAACGLEPSPVSAAEPQPKSDIPSAMATEASPTIEPSPTARTLPASLEASQEALKELGYEIRQGERGWELVSPQNQIVLVASDTMTIQALGASNEVIISPEQAFGITTTNGLGMEQLLTLSNQDGVPTHTFLERAGHWAEVIQPYTNFHELDQCPAVPLEAVWNGQLAQSEALTSQPFPEGTLVPDYVDYLIRFSPAGYWVLLHDRVAGYSDMSIQYIREVAKKENYHRRYVSCYQTVTPEGAEAIIAAEQALMPDGETWRFEHTIMGREMPGEEDVNQQTETINLSDGILLAAKNPPKPGLGSVLLRPTIYGQRYDGSPLYNTGVYGMPSYGSFLYLLPQNNPLLIRPELEALIQDAASYDQVGTRYVATAGDELQEFQYLIFTPREIRWFQYGNSITYDFFGTP